MISINNLKKTFKTISTTTLATVVVALAPQFISNTANAESIKSKDSSIYAFIAEYDKTGKELATHHDLCGQNITIQPTMRTMDLYLGGRAKNGLEVIRQQIYTQGVKGTKNAGKIKGDSAGRIASYKYLGNFIPQDGKLKTTILVDNKSCIFNIERP